MTKCESLICALCLKQILGQRIDDYLPLVKENADNLDAQTLEDNIKCIKSEKTDKADNAFFIENQPTVLKKAETDSEGLNGRGLLYYKKWWEKKVVDIFISGNCITGTPIFINKNTLRVINDLYSYFVPLEKIDYIRTNDGLKFQAD